MRPQKPVELPLLFKARLDQILNSKHPLFILANMIDWASFEQELGAFYADNKGAPAKPIRLMIGLHFLKYAFNESDESIVARLVENPYWQYFCGYTYLQHEPPIDPTSMTRFRRRIGESGVETFLKGLLDTAKKAGLLTSSDVQHVNADTTVQEKAIAFPTDARLYHKVRVKLVRAAEQRGIRLRQSYKRVGKKMLARQAGYAQAKQTKRARKATRKLKTYLGRVYRDILRQVDLPDAEQARLLQIVERIYTQKRTDKDKTYSVHAPEVA